MQGYRRNALGTILFAFSSFALLSLPFLVTILAIIFPEFRKEIIAQGLGFIISVGLVLGTILALGIISLVASIKPLSEKATKGSAVTFFIAFILFLLDIIYYAIVADGKNVGGGFLYLVVLAYVGISLWLGYDFPTARYMLPYSKLQNTKRRTTLRP